MSDIYGLFIIESLEEDEYFDGKVLKEILGLSNVKVQYIRVFDKADLKKALETFSESRFRYLHISCHATNETLNLSDETIFYEELDDLIANKVTKKRIFLSACDLGNDFFASEIIKHGAYSVVGSSIPLNFDKAVLFWASFFHIMNEKDEEKMKREQIKYVLKCCVDMFEIPMNYYSFIRDSNSKMRRLKIRPFVRMDNRVVNLIITNQ